MKATDSLTHSSQPRLLYRRILLGLGLIAMTTGVSACSTVSDWMDALNPFS